jgi:DNA invertase Pin-like site-specific DNA recombinase
MFGMLAVFGEFEREMIVARVNAGNARAKANGARSGMAIGRPRVAKDKEAAVRAELDRGTGIAG